MGIEGWCKPRGAGRGVFGYVVLGIIDGERKDFDLQQRNL